MSTRTRSITLGGEDRWHLYCYLLDDNDRPGGLPYREARWFVSATIGGEGREGHYLGTILKGHWRVGPYGMLNRNFEVEVALGGEDSMLQTGLTLGPLGSAAVGVRVPRRWLRKVVYERRSWSLRPARYGDLLRWSFALDETGAEMRDYYLRQGEAWPEGMTRAAFWRGWDGAIGRRWLDVEARIMRPIFGRAEYVTEAHVSDEHHQSVYQHELPPWEALAALREQNPAACWLPVAPGAWIALAPLPEGLYQLEIEEVLSCRRRERWLRPKDVRRGFQIKALQPPQFAGKGENSWDCGDDGIYEMSTFTARNVGEAVAEYVKHVLGYRKRYGLPSAPDTSERTA